MKFSGIALALLTVSGVQNESSFGEAYQHTSFRPHLKRNVAPRRIITPIHFHEPGLKSHAEEECDFSNSGKNDIGRQLRQMGAGVIAATAISFAAATSNPSQLPSSVANAAELNLSRGAIVIELTAPTPTTITTGAGDDESIVSPTKNQFKKFDASQEQKLLQTLLKNRKELGASIGRIQESIQNELQIKDSSTGPTAARIWTEIYQEILSIEGDVVPKVQITPPADLANLLKDLRDGKLNLLVNGEIINVSVEPTFGKDEDDLIIRIKGFKGGMLPKVIEESLPPSAYYGPIRSWLSQFQTFWSFWDSPTTLFAAEGPAFLSSITNGELLISGVLSAVVLSYVASYSYYVQQKEAEAAAAAAKKAAIAEKAKQKKAAKSSSPAKKAEPKKKATKPSSTAKTAEPKEKVVSSPPSAKTVETEEKFSSSPVTPTEAEKKAAASPSEEETSAEPEKKKKRHRFRFWKNR